MPQPLAVQVLVVGHGVGDAPRHGPRMSEVLDARHAGEGEADDVELGTRETHLLVAPRQLDHPVRVARDERQPASGPVPADDPRVAARRLDTLDTLGVEEGQHLLAQPVDDVGVEELRRERAEEQVDAPEDAERRPRRPRARLGGIHAETERLDLRGTREPLRQRLVDTADVGREPRLGLVVEPLEAPSDRRLQAHLAREPVPRQAGGPDVLGGAALHAPAVVLELPAPVQRRHAALEPRELHDVVGAQVGHAEGVAADVAHGVSRRRPHPCHRSTSMRAVTRGRSRTR